jgi:hypothetical protein
MLPPGQPEDTPPFDELFTTESPLTDSPSTNAIVEVRGAGSTWDVVVFAGAVSS